jgi:hypothetical protein
MNFENLKAAVLAVEENNRINNAKWGDWSSAADIALTYDLEPLDAEDVRVLERAIASNGETVDTDMNDAHNAEYGVKFNTWRV